MISLFSGREAAAYNEDTHFYGTYAMARYAGIRHEVASRMALSAQWMDESYISDPTSLMILPLTGVRKRRLLHFPSFMISGSANTAAQEKLGSLDALSDLQKEIAESLGKRYESQLNSVQLMTETTEDNPFASELLMEGLRAGDLMMASAGLHTIEDSYAHAGTPAELGHALFWHWPDRPYDDLSKYFRMTKTVIKAITAIRSLLPTDALDCNLQTVSTGPNCQASAEALAEAYNSTPLVKATVGYDILKDRTYIRTAIKDLLLRMNKAKYINLDLPKLMSMLSDLPIAEGDASRAVVEKLLKTLIINEQDQKTGFLNLNFMLTDLGRLRSNPTDAKAEAYMRKFGPGEFIASIAQQLMLWEVPTPLTTSHRMELEDDEGRVRKQEMKIRNSRMQVMIESMFGTKIEMIPNSTRDEIGFAREVLLDRTAETKIKVDKDIRYVTFSVRERNHFDNVIFKFLFPDLNESDLRLVVAHAARVSLLTQQIGVYVNALSQIDNNKNLTFIERKTALAQLGWKFGLASKSVRLASAAKETIDALEPMMPKFMFDLLSTRLMPSPHNFDYRSPTLLNAQLKAGLVKPLLTSKDIWTLETLKEFDRMQAGRFDSVSPVAKTDPRRKSERR